MKHETTSPKIRHATLQCSIKYLISIARKMIAYSGVAGSAQPWWYLYLKRRVTKGVVFLCGL